EAVTRSGKKGDSNSHYTRKTGVANGRRYRNRLRAGGLARGLHVLSADRGQQADGDRGDVWPDQGRVCADAGPLRPPGGGGGGGFRGGPGRGPDPRHVPPARLPRRTGEAGSGLARGERRPGVTLYTHAVVGLGMAHLCAARRKPWLFWALAG